MRLREKLLSITHTSNKDTQDRELYLYHVITSNGIIIRKNTDSLCWTPESNIIPESELQVGISTYISSRDISLLSRAQTPGAMLPSLCLRLPLCKMSNSSWWAAGSSVFLTRHVRSLSMWLSLGGFVSSAGCVSKVLRHFQCHRWEGGATGLQ